MHRIVKRIPVPTRSTSITGPHTKASTSDMILLNIYYLSSLILFSFLKCKKEQRKFVAPSTYELSIAIYDHSVNIYFKVIPMLSLIISPCLIFVSHWFLVRSNSSSLISTLSFSNNKMIVEPPN